MAATDDLTPRDWTGWRFVLAFIVIWTCVMGLFYFTTE